MATDVVNPRARTIVEDAGQGPDGIALDMQEGHIYWTGMGNPSADDGFIRRSNLDGSNVMTVIPAGGTYTPKQLRIDKQNGKLYWADREGMRVMRSNMDGTMIETLVTTGSSAADRMDNSRWCVGIAIDVEGGFVYWSQKGSDNGMVGSLRRTHLVMPQGQNSTNRSDIEVLYSGLPEPIDIDLDLENELIYWTDRGDDTINRGPIEIPNGSTAANRMDRQILVRGVREAIGVTLDLGRGKLYFTGGTGGRVGMANLDGTSAMDLLTGSAGLTGIQVVELP
jgi:DNA-binding beta-propeller fold protein YncE